MSYYLMFSMPSEFLDLCLHRTGSAWLYALTIYALLDVIYMEDKMGHNAHISGSWIRSIAPELREREDYWTRLINLDIHSVFRGTDY